MSDGAEYVISIAAEMPDGAKLVSQLDAVSSALLAAGVDADAMADAVSIASNALTEASAASKNANDALGAGTAKYKELEQAAEQAAKAQEKASRLGVVPPDVAASVESSSAALSAYVSVLKKLETDAAAAGATEKSLAVTLANTKQAVSAGTAAIKERDSAIKQAADDEKKAIVSVNAAEQSHDRQLKKTAGALRGLGGPLGSVGAWAINAADDFGDMSKTMGGANAAALIAASAFASVLLVLGAVAVGAAAATLAIAGWAVGLADSKRNTDLATEAMQAMHPELIALQSTISAVAKETGKHTDELQELAGQLKEAKVAARDIPDALRAAALAEAALGNGGASDFIADLKAGKRAAGELSREVSNKLGPVVAKQMIGLSAQSQHFHDTVGSLFGGLNIEPVLAGLQRLVALFDENTAAGAAIKTVFEGVFQPLIDSADKASVVIEAFALGFLIGATKLYIALKPAIKGISEFFGFDDPATADSMAMVTSAGELLVPVLVGLAGAFTGLVAVTAIVAAGFALPLIALTALVAGVVYAGVQVYGAISGAWQKATNYLNSITLEGVGTAIMQGLANGIIGAASLPLQAIVGAANAAIAGAKAALGIHSPSKVFAEIGGYTAEGFADGVDDGAGQASAAMTDLVTPPAQAPATAVAGGGGSAPSAGKAFDFSGAVFNFTGVKDAEHAKELFEEMLTRFVEGQADSISGPDAAT